MASEHTSTHMPVQRGLMRVIRAYVALTSSGGYAMAYEYTQQIQRDEHMSMYPSYPL